VADKTTDRGVFIHSCRFSSTAAALRKKTRLGEFLVFWIFFHVNIVAAAKRRTLKGITSCAWYELKQTKSGVRAHAAAGGFLHFV
jgi:hypothetical protein